MAKSRGRCVRRAVADVDFGSDDKCRGTRHHLRIMAPRRLLIGLLPGGALRLTAGMASCILRRLAEIGRLILPACPAPFLRCEITDGRFAMQPLVGTRDRKIDAGRLCGRTVMCLRF